MRRIRRLLAGLTLAAATFASPAAFAQAWPTKPVTMVVPFAAGTSSDSLARGFAEFMGKELGQTIVIENRGGAGGNVGASQVARAQPDGYTFLFATTGQAATNKLMYKNLNYNSDKDLQPVVLIGKLPVIVAVKSGGKFKDMKQLLDYAKSNPGKLNVGFPGNGTLGHITGLLFAKSAGLQINAVQYNGSSQIVTDILGGHIDVGMDSAGGYLSNVQSKDLSALAFASAKRFGLFPDVPTVSEAGLPGFEASVWYAVLAPTNTPAEIIAKMNAAANKYLGSAEGKAFYAKLGVETSGGSPADLKAFIASETAKWAPVIADAKIEF